MQWGAVTAEGFLARGWARFGHDPVLADWIAAARPAVLAAMADPAHADQWRCDGTWFAGVNVLANDAEGRLGAAPPLAGAAMTFLAEVLGPPLPLDAGQLSVTRPGYPRPGAEETAAAARFRRDRDAAHVDGILPVGPDRRRMLRAPHAWILGVPLTDCDPGAAPLVVWEGSHHLMRRALAAALAGHPPADWAHIDLTEAYAAARREVFATCPRIPLPARPGEAQVLHRLSLHGVAPWAPGATAAPEGRAVAYFRPELPGGPADWLVCP